MYLASGPQPALPLGGPSVNKNSLELTPSRLQPYFQHSQSSVSFLEHPRSVHRCLVLSRIVSCVWKLRVWSPWQPQPLGAQALAL